MPEEGYFARCQCGWQAYPSPRDADFISAKAKEHHKECPFTIEVRHSTNRWCVLHAGITAIDVQIRSYG